MPAKSISALKAEAKEKGIPTSLIRENLDSAVKLQALIANYGKPKGGTKVKKATPRKATRKATRTTTRRTTATATTPKRRGRPPGSKNKTTATATPPKRRGRPPGRKNRVQTPQPRKTATRKVTKTNSNGDAGRFTLDGINWKETEGWNPRPGSPPDLIIKAVRKVANRNGEVDRERVFELLKSHARSWGRVKKSKADAETNLRYRISRVMWHFAIQTGQHQTSENRAEYGTAGTGEGVFKRKRTTRTTTTRTKAAQTAPKRRGRPPGSKNKPKAPVRRGRPPKATTTRRRGRPATKAKR